MEQADSLLGEEEPVAPLESEASPERLKTALESGGRAVVTVRSKKTGGHVSLRFAAKKKEPDGRGWVSRALRDGRVGISEADAVFVDDPTLDWPDCKIGIFDLRTGEWRPAKDGDPARVWAAEKAFFWANGRYDLDEKAQIFMELSCSVCGLPLTDPVSIERGIGPDCFGRQTNSKSAVRS